MPGRPARGRPISGFYQPGRNLRPQGRDHCAQRRSLRRSLLASHPAHTSLSCSYTCTPLLTLVIPRNICELRRLAPSCYPPKASALMLLFFFPGGYLYSRLYLSIFYRPLRIPYKDFAMQCTNSYTAKPLMPIHPIESSSPNLPSNHEMHHRRPAPCKKPSCLSS
jgi:hypothetical protein